jgi:TonB dependent receptor
VPPSVSDFAGSSAYTSASSYYCIQDASKPAVLVQRGSAGRTSWTGNLDLSLAYIPQWANKKLTLEVSVFNLFDSQKATELNEVRDYSRSDSNATRPPYKQNLNYLSATSYQDPRSVQLTARYEF